MSLIVSDASEPTATDKSAARLGSAASLLTLLDPPPWAARLDVVPRKVLQRDEPAGWSSKLRRRMIPFFCTVIIHLGFAAAFAFLLTWREETGSREVEIPVEVVAEVPPQPSSTPAKPQPEPPKPAILAAPAPPAPPSPEPRPELQARQEPKAEAPKPADPQPPVPPVPAPPPLVAPPPDAAPSATQAEVNKPANLAPDQHQVDAATHEARPPDVPDVLTTADPKASFAVPAKAEPKVEPAEKPAPAAPAKVPSETDKLAAALPMDTSAMPSSFRAVLSGSGTFVSAAYKGVVFGRLGRDPDINEKARRQHLKGQVLVSFSIDDEGGVKDLSVLQTSGNAALDALGLAMIRAAAPFPPPPSDGQRTFTPALSFGE